MLLQIDSLDAYYEKSHVLQGVSLNVEQGESVALIGRNGAGKSTTMRTIMNAGPRARGTITVDGESVVGMNPFEVVRRGVAWVPEGRRVFPNLTVEENLRLGKKAAEGRDGTWDMDRIFDLFPMLEERLEQRAGTLSGGEQQMLTLGRALISSPKLLLIDEPFEGLMPSLVTKLGDILDDLVEEDITLLIAEQNVGEVLGIVEQVYVLENGRIVIQDDVQSLTQEELEAQIAV